MRILLLRHEERFSDPTLLTELTNKGKKNAKELVERLSTYPIKDIYSSPFIRTLQTIEPFSLEVNKKIKIENGLYEYMLEGVFKPNNYYRINNGIYKGIISDDFNIDPIYTSIVKEPQNKLDSEITILDRVNKMLQKLVDSSNKVILLVSHQSTINGIIKHYINSRNLDDDYPLGGLSELVLDENGDLLSSQIAI